MNVLFVHNNFPGQFRHIAHALSLDPQVRVAAIGSGTSQSIPNVNLIKYPPLRINVAATHPNARHFDIECHRADKVIAAAASLTSAGFKPDVIIVHPGWGEALPLRTLFPGARIIVYCEFFYGAHGKDVGFDPEFPAMEQREQVRLNARNAATLLALIDADIGISPTPWQRSTFPEELQSKIKVLHEGIDIDVAKPNPRAILPLSDGRVFSSRDEIITYSARSLEPLRGSHVFMRAIPRILAERPHAEILIIGDEAKAPYGLRAPKGETWKSVFYKEIMDKTDVDRVHFTGALMFHDYLAALQISRTHVYLTYPFVLSWSLIEAMSCGCLVIASDTAPVRDVVNSGNGVLFPFFSIERLAEYIVDALANPDRYAALRKKARDDVAIKYDMRRKCVPEFLAMIGREPVNSWLSKV